MRSEGEKQADKVLVGIYLKTAGKFAAAIGAVPPDVARAIKRLQEDEAKANRRKQLGPCPNDTNGDGDCGRPTCPLCSPQHQ